MAVIDLSQLPAPLIIEVPDFETLLAERKEALIALYPADEQAAIRRVLALESDPIVKVLQESTYREILLRQRVNEAAQAVMVAYAIGSDLDQQAARNNVQRLTITPDAVPPVDAVMESDDALRVRVPKAFEGLSVAGPTGAYEFHAKSADGRVQDVSATSPSPATVLITVLSREGDSKAAADLLTTVSSALSDESVRPVAYRVTVQGITEETYQELERLISDAKPCSRHLLGMSINLQVSGEMRIAAASYDSDDLTVYPYTPDIISVSGALYGGAAVKITTLCYYPVDTVTQAPNLARFAGFFMHATDYKINL